MQAITPRNLSSLAHFIEGCFDSKELLLFLEEHLDSSFVAGLPTESESRRSLSHNSVRLLERHGLIDHDLIAALIRARPHRAAQLRQIADRLMLSPVDEAELKTGVWRLPGIEEASRRLKWVENLERHLLIRERARDDRSRAVADGEIDRHTRLLRGSPTLGAGSVVAGARLERELGRGNFGTVWLARQIGSGAVVATKIFNLDRLGDGVMLWRFRRSIRAMALLGKSRGVPTSVPRLVEVAEDTLAFSMTYLNGGTIEQIERRGWSLATKLSVFTKICEAVDFAHNVGIIHRDIKPANILLASDGSPVLVDYDIADIRFVTQLSVARGGLGTPIFAAPEQLENADYADVRSDIYSLGRVLHYLLLEGSPGYQIERDPALDNLRHCPAALVAIVRRATQWDPRRRFPSVRALLAELARCQTGLAAVRARALGAQRWIRHNALLLAVIGTISCSSVGYAIFERIYAQVQAELAASKENLLSRVRAEQAAARISAEQIHRGLQELAMLREELSQLAASEASAEEIVLHARRLGAQFDAVQKGLDAATASLSRRQAEMADLLGNEQGDVQVAVAAPQVAPPDTGSDPDGRRLASHLEDGAVDDEGVAPVPPSALTVTSPPRDISSAPRTSRPPVAKNKRYHDIESTIDREARPELKACMAANRFNADSRPIHLLLTIGEDGRLKDFGATRRLETALQACLRGSISRLNFGRGQKEIFDYVIER